MKFHTLFFSKLRKDVGKMSSAAVVIGALRVKVYYFITVIYFQSTSKVKVIYFCLFEKLFPYGIHNVNMNNFSALGMQAAKPW